MNIPGFTAETSIYRTATKYRLNTGGMELTGEVRPALLEKFFVRVDVTEEFPFLHTKLSPYFDR